jgi:hypothetical protein
MQAAARNDPVAAVKNLEKRMYPPIDFTGKLDGRGRWVNPSERRADRSVPFPSSRAGSNAAAIATLH